MVEEQAPCEAALMDPYGGCTETGAIIEQCAMSSLTHMLFVYLSLNPGNGSCRLLLLGDILGGSKRPVPRETRSHPGLLQSF